MDLLFLIMLRTSPNQALYGSFSGEQFTQIWKSRGAGVIASHMQLAWEFFMLWLILLG